jgi:shikimate kinase
MPYHRIHILGGPGSGKSTIAHALSRAYDMPVFGLDTVYAEDTSLLYARKIPPPDRPNWMP